MNNHRLKPPLTFTSKIMMISLTTCIMMFSDDYIECSYSKSSNVNIKYQMRKYDGIIITKNRQLIF